jgi:hypothetical protein
MSARSMISLLVRPWRAECEQSHKDPTARQVVAQTSEQASLRLQPRHFSYYFALAASPDKMLPRYNVNTFLNSATIRILSLGSASV